MEFPECRPSYTKPGQMATYFTPDDGSDPRRHYPDQYVRDFTYTFTMASDVVNGMLECVMHVRVLRFL